MQIFLYIIYEFFKTGLFAVGGGLATLPFLYKIAAKYSWLDISSMTDMIAVSESTPGPIGINMATYCGFNAGHSLGGLGMGIFGAVCATLSLVLPSVIIIILVAKALDKFQKSKYVANAFTGLRPAVCGLIASACFTVFKTACLDIDLYDKTGKILSLFNVRALILFAVLFALTKKIKLHPIFIIIPSAIIGILLEM